MRLFPKVLLRWKEPRALHRAGQREAQRSLARMVPIIVLASLVLIGLTCSVSVEAAARVGIASGLLLIFLYATSWVYRVFPCWIEVSEKGISQSVTNDDGATWTFEEIGHCRIGSIHVGGGVRRVLIETKQGDSAMIGIADSVSTDELQAILLGKGVKVIMGSEPENPATRRDGTLPDERGRTDRARRGW